MFNVGPLIPTFYNHIPNEIPTFYNHIISSNILVGGIPTPLKNMSSSLGIILPNIWKKKHVPNHQQIPIKPPLIPIKPPLIPNQSYISNKKKSRLKNRGFGLQGHL